MKVLAWTDDTREYISDPMTIINNNIANGRYSGGSPIQDAVKQYNNPGGLLTNTAINFDALAAALIDF